MQYCAMCGEKLVFAQNLNRGYDRVTGKKFKDGAIYKCPNYNDLQYGIGPNFVHDRVEIWDKAEQQTYMV